MQSSGKASHAEEQVTGPHDKQAVQSANELDLQQAAIDVQCAKLDACEVKLEEHHQQILRQEEEHQSLAFKAVRLSEEIERRPDSDQAFHFRQMNVRQEDQHVRQNRVDFDLDQHSRRITEVESKLSAVDCRKAMSVQHMYDHIHNLRGDINKHSGHLINHHQGFEYHSAQVAALHKEISGMKEENTAIKAENLVLKQMIARIATQTSIVGFTRTMRLTSGDL